MSVIFSLSSSAQIEYSGGQLLINGAQKKGYFNVAIDKWTGLYWSFLSDSKFFMIDVSTANPRIAGAGDKVMFYNSLIKRHNSIEVAKVLNASDAKFKENISTLSNGSDIIMKLRPVSYTWIDRSESQINALNRGIRENNRDYGFIAQEVEDVCPEIVETNEDGDKLVNYIALIPMLVETVQDLQLTVKNQQTLIEELIQNDNSLSSKIKSNQIISCSPSPTTDNITIKVNIRDDNTRKNHLTIRSIAGTLEKLIEINQSEVTESVADIDNGIHIVSLYVNDELCDSKRFIKN